MSDISRLVLEIDSSGVKVANGNLAEFSKRAKESQQSATSLDGVMSQLNMTSIAAGAGILSLYKAFNSLVGSIKSFGSQAVQSFSHFEQIESSLQGTLKSVKKGTAMFEDLRKFSFDTTFGVDTLANAANQLLGVGETASTVKTIMLQLGNVASGDTQKFNELVEIFTKIQNAGKASSMQLSQFALRGVPIYQYLKDLKEIGVQGTATGEDIKKAFEEMTKEGEVFHGTMARIKDTIQGKEGFISDTWREFLTSFAEASGLADMYRAALDTVYDALQGVVDWLQMINENPVYKAIFQGVLVGTLTALAALIGGALIIALKSVIAHLVSIAALQAVINPVKAVAGLAVAAGVTAGALVLVKNALKDAGDEADTTAEKLGKLSNIDLTQMKVDRINNQIEGNIAQINELKKQLEELQALQKNNDIGWADPNSYKDAKKWAADTGQTKLLRGKKSDLYQAWDNAKKAYGNGTTVEIENTKRQIVSLQKCNEELQKSLDLQNGILNSQQLYQKAIEKAPEFTKATLTSSEKQLAELQKQFEELNHYASAKEQTSKSRYDYATGKDVTTVIENKLPQNIIDAFDKAGNRLKKQIEEAKIKVAVESQSDYQKFLQSSFGFTGEEVFQGATSGKPKGVSNEVAAKNFFLEKQEKQNTKMNSFRDAGLIGKDDLSMANEYLDLVNQIVEAFAKKDDKNIDNDTIAMLQSLKDDAVTSVYEKQMSQYESQLDLLKEQTAEMRRQTEEKKKLLELGYSEEQADNLIAKEKEYNDELLRQTDLWGYVKQKISENLEELGLNKEEADMFASSLTNIVSQTIPNGLVDGFQAIGKAMAEGAEEGDAMKKIFKQMMAQMASQLAISCVAAGVHLIAQSGWAGVPAALGLFALGGAAGIAAGAMSALGSSSSDKSAEDEQKKQLELLKSLSEEYKNLQEAIKEQEEYYLARRTQLNADNYKEKVVSYPVHDMILTDQGIFSTDPKDTILAMKKPTDLLGNGNGGNVVIKVIINNNAPEVEVETQEEESDDGSKNLIVNISRAIAADYATGANGWDSAYYAQQSRTSGRRVSI